MRLIGIKVSLAILLTISSIELRAQTSTSSLTIAVTDPLTTETSTSYLSGSINNPDYVSDFSYVQGGALFTSAVTGGAFVPSTSTQHQVNGISGFVNSQSTTANAVAIYGQAICAASEVQCWGANMLVSSISGQTDTNLVGQENDVITYNTSDIGAAFAALAYMPAQSTNVTGFVAGTPEGGGKWTQAFMSVSGSSTYAFVAGATAGSGDSLASEPYVMLSSDSSGAFHTSEIFTDTGGSIVLEPFDNAAYVIGSFGASLVAVGNGTSDEMVSVPVAGDYFTNALAGDMALRSFSNRVLVGGGSGTATTFDGSGNVVVPNNMTAIDFIATGAAPVVTSGQISYGGTTAASSNCGSISATGCIVVNISGATHYIPYY